MGHKADQTELLPSGHQIPVQERAGGTHPGLPLTTCSIQAIDGDIGGAVPGVAAHRQMPPTGIHITAGPENAPK